MDLVCLSLDRGKDTTRKQAWLETYPNVGKAKMEQRETPYAHLISFHPPCLASERGRVRGTGVQKGLNTAPNLSSQTYTTKGH